MTTDIPPRWSLRALPVAWRRALAATVLLWLGTQAVVAITTAVVPIDTPAEVMPAEGFGGWEVPPDRGGPALLADGLVRFDALWYLAIAEDGYPTTEDVPQAAAFFPGYPTAVRILRPLTGGSTLFSALLLSAMSCVAAFAGLHRLAEHLGDGHDDLGEDASRDVPGQAVLVAATFPTAFFLLAPYSEAFFLALSVWALVLHLRGRRLYAALLLAVATVTRPVGMLLAVPIALGVLAGDDQPGPVARLRRGIPPALGAAVGLGAMAVHGATRWGDPLAFRTAQAGWQRVLTTPWATLVDAVRFGTRLVVDGTLPYHFLDLAVLGLVALGVAVLVRRREWPLLAHALLSIGIWLVQPFPGRPLMSTPRFALALPGVLLGLAIVTRHRRSTVAWLLVSGGLLVVHLTLFTRWSFVF